jgi:hypothetical protein
MNEETKEVTETEEEESKLTTAFEVVIDRSKTPNAFYIGVGENLPLTDMLTAYLALTAFLQKLSPEVSEMVKDVVNDPEKVKEILKQFNNQLAQNSVFNADIITKEKFESACDNTETNKE